MRKSLNSQSIACGELEPVRSFEDEVVLDEGRKFASHQVKPDSVHGRGFHANFLKTNGCSSSDKSRSDRATLEVNYGGFWIRQCCEVLSVHT